MLPLVSQLIEDFKNVSKYFYRLLLHQNNCGLKLTFKKYKSYDYERLNSEDMKSVKL